MTFTLTIILYWVQVHSVFFASLWRLHWTRPIMNASPFEWPPSACRKYLHIPRSDQLSEVGWLQSSIPFLDASQSTPSWTLFLFLMGVTAATERSYWLVDPGLPLSRGERGSNQDTPPPFQVSGGWFGAQQELFWRKTLLKYFLQKPPFFPLASPFLCISSGWGVQKF